MRHRRTSDRNTNKKNKKFSQQSGYKKVTPQKMQLTTQTKSVRTKKLNTYSLELINLFLF